MTVILQSLLDLSDKLVSFRRRGFEVYLVVAELRRLHTKGRTDSRRLISVKWYTLHMDDKISLRSSLIAKGWSPSTPCFASLFPLTRNADDMTNRSAGLLRRSWTFTGQFIIYNWSGVPLICFNFWRKVQKPRFVASESKDLNIYNLSLRPRSSALSCVLGGNFFCDSSFSLHNQGFFGTGTR